MTPRRAVDEVGHLARHGEPHLWARDLEALGRGHVVLLLLERVDDGEHRGQHLPALCGHLERVHALLAPLLHAAAARHGMRGGELVWAPAFPLPRVRAAEQLDEAIARTSGLHCIEQEW
jgi:hypothetical protein